MPQCAPSERRAFRFRFLKHDWWEAECEWTSMPMSWTSAASSDSFMKPVQSPAVTARLKALPASIGGGASARERGPPGRMKSVTAKNTPVMPRAASIGAASVQWLARASSNVSTMYRRSSGRDPAQMSSRWAVEIVTKPSAWMRSRCCAKTDREWPIAPPAPSVASMAW